MKLIKFSFLGVLLGSGLVIQAMEPNEFRSGIYTLGSLGALSSFPMLLEATDPTIWETAKSGDIEEMKSVLKKKEYDINQGDEKGMTPLMYAAEAGKTGMVQCLIDNGADISLQSAASTFKRTALTHAITSKDTNIDTYKPLINRQVMNEVDTYGDSPVANAVIYRNIEALKLLIKNKAEVNIPNKDNDQTALMIACEQGELDMVALLLEAGAQVHRIDKDKETALHKALTVDSLFISDITRDIVEDDRLTEKEILDTISNRFDTYAAIVSLLKDNGASLNAQTVEGKTPLHYAAKNLRATELVVLLDAYKKQGISVDIRDNAYHRPFDLAQIPYEDAEDNEASQETTRNEVIRLLQVSNADLKEVREEYKVDAIESCANTAKKKAFLTQHNFDIRSREINGRSYKRPRCL